MPLISFVKWSFWTYIEIVKCLFWLAVEAVMFFLQCILSLVREYEMWMSARQINQVLQDLHVPRRRVLTLKAESRPACTFKDCRVIFNCDCKKWHEEEKDDETCNFVQYIEHQIVIDQLNFSSLWKLPFEIRQMIWLDVLGRKRIHIVRRCGDGRLTNVFCSENGPFDPDRRDMCVALRDENRCYVHSNWPLDHRPLSLMRSCRQIYSECIAMLYWTNTFVFDDAQSYQMFVRRMPPHRRKMVSSILFLYSNIRPDDLKYEFSFMYGFEWRSFCGFPNATFPRLRSLTFAPSGPMWMQDPRSSESTGAMIQDFLNYLQELQVTKHTSFTLIWPECPPTEEYLLKPWWGHPRNLPLKPKMNIKLVPYERIIIEKLVFFTPFPVQCLHCRVYPVIKTATRFVANVRLKRKAPNYAYFCHYSNGGSGPARTYYWVFHNRCGGCIEFQHDWRKNEWSVVQGAKEISEEEARRQLSGEASPAVLFPGS